MPTRYSQQYWDQVARKAGFKWLEPVEYALQPTAAQCLQCDKTWKATPSQAKNRGSGCKDCHRKRNSQQIWDKAGKTADLEWLEPVRSGAKPHKARCLKCGHEWRPRPNSVKKQGSGCKRCGIKKISEALRLDLNKAQERASKINVQWLEPPKNAKTPTRARCLVCQHEWKPRPGNVYVGYGCPQCGKKKYSKSLTADQEQRDREAERINAKWLEPTATGRVRKRIECQKCGHVWKATPSGVRMGYGCPECVQQGFKSSKPAIIYLLKHADGYAKIGITNIGIKQYEDRLLRHGYKGFEPVMAWQFETGKEARDVEQRVLSWIRNDLGIPPAVLSGNGYSETMYLSAISLQDIEELVETTIASI